MNTLLSSLCSRLGLEPEHTKLLNARDTSDVWRQFAIWLLVDEEYGVLRFTKPDSREREAIQHVADLYIQKCKDVDAWKAATSDAADAPADAAWSAASAAAYAYYAASAADAAWSASYASYAAAYAYYAASAADAADAAAAAAHYERMANKLIELLQTAPMMK